MMRQKVQLVLLFLFLSHVVASVDYTSQIQPIFDDRCISCHGSMGGLNLTSYENLMYGGLSGEEVIPYNHTSSELWIRVNSGQMPPGNNDLTDEQIDLIAQWIDEGALEELDCDPTLTCGEAETCCDGLIYPTTCCETNCDEPIGECGDDALQGDLIRPADGEELSYIHIFFEWKQQPDAIGYNLQASTQQSFNNIILDVDEPTTVYIDKDSFNWDDNYHWRVKPIYNNGSSGPWTEPSEFSIRETILLGLDVNIYNDDLVEDGLVMYSQFLPYFAVGVIDKLGNEIWNTESAFMNHINSFGQLYGVNGSGVQFNYDGDILFETSDENVDMHEVKQIPSGNYMGWVPTFQTGPIPQGDWTFLFQAQGYNADGMTNEFPWMGMRIVEWDDETGQEVWSWDPFMHFTMDDHDLYGDIWWGAYFDGAFDWMHTNAFHFDAEESVIYVSHRHLSRISKIAYPSGEVIWNIGMPGQYNTGSDNICTDLGNSFQHNIQLLDDGTLLFFDNGNLSEMLMDDSNPTTRIRRIRVIDDSYCETVWQYDLPQNLFGLGMGSVQLLDNGNYSIYTYGNGLGQAECSIFEITSDGDMVWKVTAQNQNAAWYRAYKVPSIHPNAFSVVADGYTVNEAGNAIELSGNTLDYTIFNKSGY
ncbi:MAG: aryl-sulfate sulfotransferase, partial [Candidatus Marinimicrobia bacterium]|nr:aryl-sulfate sulfotransferase [Candidatus Neomarinimicrobiota bacterium]